MNVKTKKYSFGTCEMCYNKKRKCLYITLIRKGVAFFATTITEASSDFAKRFFTIHTEDDIIGLFSLNMDII